jgi:cytochrome c553
MKNIPSLLLIALIVAACGKEQAPAGPEQAPAPKADLAAGKAIAEAKCVACHGLDGKSTGPDIPHLAGQKEAYLVHALNQYRQDIRPHAALQALSKELSLADEVNVAAYYASQPPVMPAEGALTGTDPVATGKAETTVCGTCHGSDGNSKLKGTPSLAGQHSGYIVAAMQAYTTSARKDVGMNKLAAGLDKGTLENIASYYASQKPSQREKPAAGDPAKGEPLSGKCGGCHGLQGHSADAKTPSLAGQDAAYMVKTMKAYRDGSRAHAEMKAMLAGVSDKDLEHIAAFYNAQVPKAAQDALPMAGQAWAERCDKCHGPQSANPAMVSPRIDGQPEAYLGKALKDYRSGTRPQSAMHAMGQPLTDADIGAIAKFYSAMPPR